MKKFLIPVFLIGLIIGGVFYAKKIMAQGAGGGDGDGGGTCASVTCGQPCDEISCGCHNTGSAYNSVTMTFESCNDPALVVDLVPCIGEDRTNNLCDQWPPGQALIYKCVNPSCPTSGTCGCVTPSPTEVVIDPAEAGSCWSTCSNSLTPPVSCNPGYACQDVTGSGELRCVPEDTACAQGSGESCYCACSCSAAISKGMTFSCPQPDPDQPGKAEGPIGIGNIPGCFRCDTMEDGKGNNIDCPGGGNEIRYDELVGNTCKTYSSSVIGGDRSQCSCDSTICCPKCVPPVEVEPSDCGPGCDFTAEGPNGSACPCTGSGCNAFDPSGDSVAPTGGFQWNFGDWNNPPESSEPTCVQTNNAGVKKVTLTCEGGRTCTKEVVFACKCSANPDDPGLPDVTLTPAWYKLKDDQFHKLSDVENPIPPSVNTFDADDVRVTPDPACDGNDPDNIRCFNINQAGIVSVLGDTINLNGAPISYRQWNKLSYIKNNLFTPQTFLDYAKARKPTKTITDVNNLDQIEANKINILTTDLTIDDTTQLGGRTAKQILEDDTKIPYVLIVQGTLTIDTNFNEPDVVTDSPKALSIISTGQIKIAHGVTYIGGVFVGNSLDFAYDKGGVASEWPLKFKGNIISYASADPSQRKRTDDPLKPSIFVVFDPKVYAGVIDLLSVRTYEWNELSP